MANIHYLKDVRPPKFDGQDVQITCPFHKDGREYKPSCGVTTVTRKRGDSVIPVGTTHCFACQHHGDITELISYCFGKKDGGLYGKQWILSRFNNFEIENRSGFFKRLGVPNNSKVDKKYIDEDELASYRFTHPYMYRRHLTDDIIDTFDIGYDSKFRLSPDSVCIPSITFPVKDLNGNVLFIARRSIKGKLFHYPVSSDKPIYGLYESNNQFSASRELYICESILNALMFFKWGKPAVALLGTGAHNQVETLKHLEYRKYIICLDGDSAGLRGTKKLIDALGSYKLLDVLHMPKGVDVNDLGDSKDLEEFDNRRNELLNQKSEVN